MEKYGFDSHPEKSSIIWKCALSILLWCPCDCGSWSGEHLNGIYLQNL